MIRSRTRIQPSLRSRPVDYVAVTGMAGWDMTQTYTFRTYPAMNWLAPSSLSGVRSVAGNPGSESQCHSAVVVDPAFNAPVVTSRSVTVTPSLDSPSGEIGRAHV